MENRTPTTRIVLSAIMMALICVSTMFLRIPIPFTQGYAHLGDAMIFLSVMVLGWRYGALAAGFGSMLADILVGYGAWAPWTLVIKSIMAMILGMFLEKTVPKAANNGKYLVLQIVGMCIAGSFMVGGYYVAEGVLYGNWTAPLIGIPWNVGQFAVGMLIAVLLSTALLKTSATQYFAIRPKAPGTDQSSSK